MFQYNFDMLTSKLESLHTEAHVTANLNVIYDDGDTLMIYSDHELTETFICTMFYDYIRTKRINLKDEFELKYASMYQNLLALDSLLDN